MAAQRFFGEGEIWPLPQVRREPPALSAEGFVACPWALRPPYGGPGACGWTHDVYMLAYQQAKAAVAPPWHERNLVACLN